MPIDDLVLYMKTSGIDRVNEFPFPTPPDRHAVASSVLRLQRLGILDHSNEKPTVLGQSVAKFPVNVRIGKMLVIATRRDEDDDDDTARRLFPHALALGALLSLPPPFESHGAAVWSNTSSGHGGDALALLRAAGAYSYDPSVAFCDKNHLNAKIMHEFTQVCWW